MPNRVQAFIKREETSKTTEKLDYIIRNKWIKNIAVVNKMVEN